MITQAMLDGMSSGQSKLFDKTATITRKSYVKDTMGGQTASTSTVASNVKCRMTQNLGQHELEIADRLSIVSPVVILLSQAQSIAVGDIITISSKAYLVGEIIGPLQSYGVIVRAICSEVR